MKDTYSSTSSLKGIAILAVLMNHYLNLNVTGDSRGFANLWVAIFFIVSGYGISHSLNRLFGDNSYTVRKILVFYYGRATRIFPLFIFALIVESLIRSNGSTVLMIPGIHYSGHYWFIPSLFQCYIFAPVIYFFMRKSRILTVCASIVLFMVITYFVKENFLPESIMRILKILRSDYRGLLFLNVFIFSLSMCLPAYLNNWKNVGLCEKKILLFIMFLFVFLGMISTKYNDSIPYVYMILNESIYALVLLFIISIYMISNTISFKIFYFIGEISYSIYLFHMSVYLSVDKIFGYGMNSLSEFMLTLVFLSLFFVACIYIKGFAKISKTFNQNN